MALSPNTPHPCLGRPPIGPPSDKAAEWAARYVPNSEDRPSWIVIYSFQTQAMPPVQDALVSGKQYFLPQGQWKWCDDRNKQPRLTSCTWWGMSLVSCCFIRVSLALPWARGHLQPSRLSLIQHNMPRWDMLREVARCLSSNTWWISSSYNPLREYARNLLQDRDF
jgi:hypothetical protein